MRLIKKRIVRMLEKND